VLSIVQPGIWFGDNVEEARGLARQLNEYGARLVRDHPGRFGLFAVIGAADVQGSLNEIEYAFDTLKADGIGLLTSYQSRYPRRTLRLPRSMRNSTGARPWSMSTRPRRIAAEGSFPAIPPSSIEYATDSTAHHRAPRI